MPTTNVKESSQSSTPALAVGLWTLILLIAFFANRGTDAGQLGRLFGNLGGQWFGSDGFQDSFVGCFIAAMILMSWFGLGSLVARFVSTPRGEPHSHILEMVLSVAVGAAIWSLIWFFLGTLGLYSFPTAIASITVGAILTVVGRERLREARIDGRAPEKPSAIDLFLIALIAVPVLLALIGALAPPTAKDTLLYHFALPKAFIAQGSNAFVEGNIASYLALGGEMHNVWAMLCPLGGQRVAEAAAGAVNWLFFPLLLATVYGWARELNVSRALSLVAVLMVAAVPTAYHVASSSYVDLELALYVTLAIYAISRWWQSEANAWLIVMAIFLGAALSIKLTSVFIFAALALVIAFKARSRKELNGNAGTMLAYGMGALLLGFIIASPWYLRTWKATGSPVFPFYMSMWKGNAPGWDVERSNLFQGMNSQYGGESKSVVDYAAAPWNLSVSAQPEQPEFFDGVLGVAFLAGLPLLIWALWKFDMPVEAKIFAAVAGTMYLFWLFSSQQLRYLLPILPVLAIGIALSIARVFANNETGRSAVKWSLTAASALALLVSLAWFLQTEPVRVVLGGETRDDFLTRNLDYFPYYQYLNTQTPADTHVWLIDMRRDTYYLDRPAVSDYLFEDWTLKNILWSTRSLSEMKSQVAAMNVQYILTRHDFLFDYDRSPLVDDKKLRGENEAKLKMARALVMDPALTIKSDNKFSLVKVF